MSPKAQRPLRGAKSLSSPSSRPSGEASVPPPPAGKISSVLHEEMDRGVDMSIVRMLDWESSKIKVFWRLGFMLFRKEFFSFPRRNSSMAIHTLCLAGWCLLFKLVGNNKINK